MRRNAPKAFCTRKSTFRSKFSGDQKRKNMILSLFHFHRGNNFSTIILSRKNPDPSRGCPKNEIIKRLCVEDELIVKPVVTRVMCSHIVPNGNHFIPRLLIESVCLYDLVHSLKIIVHDGIIPLLSRILSSH